MKKILRKLTNPKLLTVLLLLVEFALLVALWAFLEYGLDNIIKDKTTEGASVSDIVGYSIIIAVRVILFIVTAFVFLRIVNREENPEYKIPWLAFMFLFPILTLTFYLVFVRVRLRRRDAEVVLPTREKLIARQQSNKGISEATIAKLEAPYQGVFRYLEKSALVDISEGNRVTYYKNGEVFFPALVEALGQAKEFIFIEFFIIGEGIWWSKIEDILARKAKEGVEVRVIYDDIGSNGVVSEAFPLLLAKKGIHCHKFHPLLPVLSNVINNRDHRKIVVVDHRFAFTGGMNMADEYANEVVRFGYWKDTMIRIEGPGIQNLIATFLQNYDLCTFVVSDYDKFLNGDYPHFDDPGVILSFGDAPGPYNGYEQIGEQNYINLLNTATKRVDISTPYLIASYPLSRALTAAAKRGVEVNLIVPGIPDKKPVYWMAKCQFHVYLEAGINIYTYTPGFNHEKQMLVDDRLCFCGTINFDFRSLTHHFECGATFMDTPCIKEVREDFDEMIAQSHLVPKDFSANVFQRAICSILKIFRALL